MEMGVSRRTFFYMVDDLREMGATISYCRKRQTYYYEQDFELRIDYKVTAICDGEARIIEGGNYFSFLLKKILHQNNVENQLFK